MSNSASYTSTAKTLHWLMSLMIFGLLLLGFYMSDLPLSPEKLKLYSWHKWAGVTIFLLAIDRKSTRLNSSHSQQSRMPSSA